MFIYRRGPQRIWLPMPHSAGCDVIADLGTISAVAASVVVAVGVKVVVWRRVVGLLLKMEVVGMHAFGRREGREEKDLPDRAKQSISLFVSTVVKGGGFREKT